MSKYITHFQTESEYQAALQNIELPNVSLVDELGEVHYHRALYGAHAGDICLYDVAEGQKFFVTANDWNLTSYPTASYPIVGIAIADEGASGVTLVSTLFSDSNGSQTTVRNRTMKLISDNINFGLTNYSKQQAAITDFNGKSNTATIIAAIKAYDLANSTDNLTGCIGGAIQAFAPTGTSAGDWYIPSAGEINVFSSTNRSIISNTLNTIKSSDENLAVIINPGSVCLSSTSATNSNMWALNDSLGYNSTSKTGTFTLRPFTIV